ncbi:MAG: hypothetical protein NUV83_02250 [Candidatus Wolfebacteria bacterium]|nr:hypothetical protein [Candidatus Wolfebacteria bacterium]
MKKYIVLGIVSTVGLAIATIVFAGSLQRIDFVNIGSPSSEASHNLQGWGTIEPLTSGGNWGQIGSSVTCDLPVGETCDKALRVTYAKDEPDHPQINGRMANVTLNSQNRWGLIKELKIRALDGIANDDFMVFIKNKKGRLELVYTYISDPSTAEIWKVHTIALDHKYWFNKGPIEITIMATGDTWNQHSAYGQLGIDWIELAGTKAPFSRDKNNKDAD